MGHLQLRRRDALSRELFTQERLVKLQFFGDLMFHGRPAKQRLDLRKKG